MIINMRPNRIPPKGPIQVYRTFSAKNPRDTHTRPATCEEANCSAFLHGWVSPCDEGTELGARRAHHIRHSRRSFVERHDPDGITRFTFPPGQRCFQASQHRITLHRPPLLITRHGDWRGNPTGWVRTHVRAEDWVDDFQTHTQHIVDAQRRG